MNKDKIDYSAIRDDQLHYWLHYLKHDASEEIKTRYLRSASNEAFKRGLIGEDWYDFYVGNAEHQPWNRWAKDDVGEGA